MKQVIRRACRWLGFEPHSWRYLGLYLQSRRAPGREIRKVAFVQPPRNAGGWILDTFCDEIARYLDVETVCFRADVERLPDADAYFHSHMFIFRGLAFRFPEIVRSRNVVLYTHPREDEISTRELRWLLNRADVVASMCTMFRNELVAAGVRGQAIEVVLAGADPDLLRPHERGQRPVGLCSGFQERKNPDIILEIVRRARDRDFVLVGKDWEKWRGFSDLQALPNFSYWGRLQFNEMHRFYAAIDVLLSPSTLEGGPMPVLEAMMANVMPVATRMGFCPDIIRQGENGYLYPVDAPAAEVVGLIEQAYRNTADVRATVSHLTWRAYSERVGALLTG